MNVGLDEVFNPKLRETVSLRVDDLRVYYRTLAGDVKALDGVTFDDRRRRDPGPRRRVRLRQVDARQEPRPPGRPDAATSRAGSSSTARSCRSGTTHDEPLPVQRGLDRAAVRDERAEPDAQDRRDGRASCWRRAASHYDTAAASWTRRLDLVGLSADVLGMYPDRALRRDEAARGDGDLDAARPVAADRRRGHLGARRVDASGRSPGLLVSSATAAS